MARVGLYREEEGDGGEPKRASRLNRCRRWRGRRSGPGVPHAWMDMWPVHAVSALGSVGVALVR